MKYKSKITEIGAIFYDGNNKAEVEKFLDTHCAEYNDTLPFICWYNDEMSNLAYMGEYIIRFPDGKVISLWNELFEKLFEPIKEEEDESNV